MTPTEKSKLLATTAGTKPPLLTEQIDIAKISKNRMRDKAIIISLSSHEGTNIVNVREYFTGSDGIMRPTTRGIAVSVRKLPELSRALRRALEKARELNLLPSDEGGE